MSSINDKNRWVWWLGLTPVLLVTLDQWVKHWARVSLKPVGEMPLINGLLRFAYVENRGAAFGLLQGARWFFLALTLAVLIFIAVYYTRLPRTKESLFLRIPLVCVFSGAAGNFIDRLLNGYVVDMFEFTFIRFPVFNVADILLVCGTIVMSYVMLFVMKEDNV